MKNSEDIRKKGITDPFRPDPQVPASSSLLFAPCPLPFPSSSQPPAPSSPPTEVQTKLTNQNESRVKKTNLPDLTFLMPLRIDSVERKENADTVIKYMYSHFNTSFIVLEADKEQKYFPEFDFKGFHYVFEEDTNEIYRKVIWINRLLALAATPYVAIWDADAIAPPEQIIDSLEKLRSGEAVMSLPFDGRFYSADKVSCTLFIKFLNIRILRERIPVMQLMHGYHSPGGAYMVNKEKYIEAGGENEKFVGWGPEDFEHIKRMEVFNLQVYYSKGVLFHLWHPAGKNSWFVNQETESRNRRELLNTCIVNIRQNEK